MNYLLTKNVSSMALDGTKASCQQKNKNKQWCLPLLFVKLKWGQGLFIFMTGGDLGLVFGFNILILF